MDGIPLQYEVVSDERALLGLKDEWTALWARSQGRYHQAFEVSLNAWYHVAKPLGRTLHCIVCRRDGQLVMVWPLTTFRKWLWKYVLPLSPDAADYTSVLVADDGDADALIKGAWRHATQKCGADFIQLPYMREAHTLYRLASRERHILLATRHDAWIAEMRHETDWAQFCKSVGELFHKKPGFFTRRLAKEGDLVMRLTEPSNVEENARLVDWLFERKRVWGARYNKRENWLDSNTFRNYLIGLLCPPSGEPCVRMLLVELNGAPVSVLIVSVGNPCAHAIISGFDENLARFKPGLVAFEYGVRWAFDNHWDLDFGAGSERFKEYWSRGNKSTAWTLHVINSPWGLAAVRAKHAFRAVRHWRGRVALPEVEAAMPDIETAEQG